MCCAHNTNDNWKTQQVYKLAQGQQRWDVAQGYQGNASVRPVATLYCAIMAQYKYLRGKATRCTLKLGVVPTSACQSTAGWQGIRSDVCYAGWRSRSTDLDRGSHGAQFPGPLFTASRLSVHRVPLTFGLWGLFASAGLGAEHPEDVAPWEQVQKRQQQKCVGYEPQLCFALRQSNKTKAQHCPHTMCVGDISHVDMWIVCRHLALMASCIRYTVTVTGVFDSAVAHFSFRPWAMWRERERQNLNFNCLSASQ